MADYILLVDSSADLTKQMAQDLEVQVLSLNCTLGEATVPEYKVSSKDFYQMLRSGGTAGTTAINMTDYIQALTPALEQGQDALILAFSSAISSTYQSACMAAQELEETFPGRKVRVVDTLSASLGFGLLVHLTAQRRLAGTGLDELADWVEAYKLNICHQFTVDDLLFLKRGGRISAATAVVGTMMSIKPVLHMDDQGRLINIGKARGRQAALKALVDKMEATAHNKDNPLVFISHGDCLEDARRVEAMVAERFPGAQITIGDVGPVIGAHSGPGTVALFYEGNPR